MDTKESPTAEVDLTVVSFGPLMNMIQTNNRFVYTGSLTKPPCTEKYYWNIVNKVYPIKPKHLNTFRYLQTQQKRAETDVTLQKLTMNGNYRVTQEIKSQEPKLMILTPSEDDPEEIRKTNHILTIVLIVDAVMVIICSGLIFMILQNV